MVAERTVTGRSPSPRGPGGDGVGARGPAVLPEDRLATNPAGIPMGPCALLIQGGRGVSPVKAPSAQACRRRPCRDAVPGAHHQVRRRGHGARWRGIHQYESRDGVGVPVRETSRDGASQRVSHQEGWAGKQLGLRKQKRDVLHRGVEAEWPPMGWAPPQTRTVIAHHPCVRGKPFLDLVPCTVVVAQAGNQQNARLRRAGHPDVKRPISDPNHLTRRRGNHRPGRLLFGTLPPRAEPGHRRHSQEADGAHSKRPSAQRPQSGNRPASVNGMWFPTTLDRSPPAPRRRPCAINRNGAGPRAPGRRMGASFPGS